MPMENSGNTNFYGGREEENRNSMDGISVNVDQFINDFLRSSSSMNPSSEQNHPAPINQTTAEAEQMRQRQLGQRQPTESFSADSHSRINIPEINTAADSRLAKKRAYDRAYRSRIKEKQKQKESNLVRLEAENEVLKCENESLKNEISLTNQRIEIQSKELDKLRYNLNEFNHKFSEQHENEQKMKSKLKTKIRKLKLRIKSLKADNALMNQISDELDKLKKKSMKQLERERQQKSEIKTLKAENDRLFDKIIASQDKVLENREIQSMVQGQSEKSEKIPASSTTSVGKKVSGHSSLPSGSFHGEL